jgi:signal transduction histidine kinase
MLETLFSNEFMPHGMCYMWRPELLWLHVISDALIFLSYISIPVTLVYILHIRKDLIFSKVMALFGAFVLLCGITHLLAVWNVWNGTYWLSGWLKAITAIVSVATAYMLWKLVPTLKIIPTVEKLKVEVTKREEVEAILQAKAQLLAIESKRLNLLNAELEAYAYASSHDLKSPLRGIRQLASWIEEDLKSENITLPEESREHFELMQSRISRMELLLDDLLEYSKAGHISGEFALINVKTLCVELFELLNTSSKITLHVTDNIKEFQSLKAPLILVLRNLLDNAIKHNDKDAGNIWVDVTENDDYFEFSIKDDGPGVNPNNFERMTNIFSTLQSKDDVEGSGMGLAIIKKIINKFEGNLSFSSPKGEGLTVTFTWPKAHQLTALITAESAQTE